MNEITKTTGAKSIPADRHVCQFCEDAPTIGDACPARQDGGRCIEDTARPFSTLPKSVGAKIVELGVDRELAAEYKTKTDLLAFAHDTLDEFVSIDQPGAQLAAEALENAWDRTNERVAREERNAIEAQKVANERRERLLCQTTDAEIEAFLNAVSARNSNNERSASDIIANMIRRYAEFSK